MDKSLLKQMKRQQTDTELLRAISASSDTDAFLVLYNRYGQRLLQYFYQALHDKEAIFDLSQNFWLFVWQNASQLIYEGNDSVEKLFFNMAVKRVADYYRSFTYKREVSLDNFLDLDLSSRESSLSLPESNCYSKEITEIIEKVLDKYPELDKQVFICQKELDYPAQQTADLFHISTESIYKRVSIIMKELRLQLRLAGYCSLFFLIFGLMMG